jgi:hypothetical protein
MNVFAIEQIKDDCAHEDYGVTRDDENGKPRREPSIIRINVAPVADAQRNDAAQKQALIGERIENDSQRTPLVIMACNIAIQTITDCRYHENGDCSITHPFKRRAMVDALAVINGHRHKNRNHQNPNDGDLVGSGHNTDERRQL